MTKLAKLSRSVEGRVTIITGAGSGMGRATAYVFADEGAKLALIDRNAEGVEQVAKEIRDAGGTANAYVADLADGAAIPALVEKIRGDLGPIDILINNAGLSVGGPIDHDMWEKAWEITMAVNLTAQARMIRACLTDLARNRDGRVVNIASTEGWGATAGGSPYTASKHGVIGLTRSMAVELGPRGINVNCVCPGPIRTNMTAAIPDEAKDKFARRRVALKRYGDPEEVAHATLSLSLPAASFINGAALVVDGGLADPQRLTAFDKTDSTHPEHAVQLWDQDVQVGQDRVEVILATDDGLDADAAARVGEIAVAEGVDVAGEAREVRRKVVCVLAINVRERDCEPDDSVRRRCAGL